MTEAIAYGGETGYHPLYRPELHEWGHAVWSLLLTPVERWARYFPAWRRAKNAGLTLTDYGATSVEEGWAEDFEAGFRIGTRDLPGLVTLAQRDWERYNVVRVILKRLQKGLQTVRTYL